MLRTAIICPDKQLAAELEKSLADISAVGLVKTLEKYPATLDLTRFVRSQAPQVLFLSVSSLDRVAQILGEVEDAAPGTQIVAIHSSYDSQLLMQVMRLGIREFLPHPIDRSGLLATLGRVKDNLERRPIQLDATDLLYAFLPSKAGSGTTTLAMNTAFALSELDKTSTLLADFDLNSGMVRFMLKLENGHGVADAAEHAGAIDDAVWPHLVTKFGPLDVLHAGKLNPNLRIEPIQIRNIVSFARRNYRAILMDLSGNLEKYSIEIMHEAKRIFVVCTPEISSLHLAREKLNFLSSMDLSSKMAILMNRCTKRVQITPKQVEELLGLPVEMTFPNDYVGVQNALTAGKHLDFGSEIGKKCAELAQLILQKRATEAYEPRKRFVEYFAISPARYSFDNRRTD